ncbi:hypothetical protein RI367_006236 [Sorochytrium milnesiophthora]
MAAAVPSQQTLADSSTREQDKDNSANDRQSSYRASADEHITSLPDTPRYVIDLSRSRVRLPPIAPSQQSHHRAKTDIEGSGDSGGSGINYAKIIDLLTNRHAEVIHDRHVAVLDRLHDIYEREFDAAHFDDFVAIMNVLWAKIAPGARPDGGNYLVPCIVRLISLCQAHIYAVMSTSKPALAGFTECLLSFSGAPQSQVSQAALETLARLMLLVTENAPPSSLPLTHRELDSHRQKLALIIESIDIGRQVSERLDLASDADASTQMALLAMLKRITAFPNQCRQLVQEQCMTWLFKTLVQASQQHKEKDILLHAIDVLWELFDSPDSQAVLLALDSSHLAGQLTSVLKQFTIARAANLDTGECRSDFLTLCLKFLRTSPSLVPAFFDAGFFEPVLHDFLQSDPVQLVATESVGKEDSAQAFELKSVAGGLLETAIDYPPARQHFLERNLISHLLEPLHFSHFTGKNKNARVLHQVKELHLMILELLERIVDCEPGILNDAVHNGLGTKLAAYLQDAYQLDNPHSSTYNFTIEHTGLVKHALKLIVAVTNSPAAGDMSLASLSDGTGESSPISLLLQQQQELQEDKSDDNLKLLVAQDGVLQELVTLLQAECSAVHANVAVETLCYILMALSTLCDGCLANQNYVGQRDVIPELLLLLKYDSPNAQERVALLSSVVNALWTAVSGCIVNEEMLFHHRGIFALLDLLDDCSQSRQHFDALLWHILGCLTELMENAKARSYIALWRSKNAPDRDVIRTVLALWSQEYQHLNVQLGSHGELTGEREPLGRPPPGVGAIPEMHTNLRTKIFAFFSKLGFLAYPHLTKDEHITLAYISRYLDFKMGDVWQEIAHDLSWENVEPIEMDRQTLALAHEVNLRKARELMLQQSDILKTRTISELDAESEYMHGLAARQQSYAQRCTLRKTQHRPPGEGNFQASLAAMPPPVQLRTKLSATPDQQRPRLSASTRRPQTLLSPGSVDSMREGGEQSARQQQRGGSGHLRAAQ